ncbi:FtsK/SpoIIIE family DNA translocase [Halanaerobium hydrogeniformans]|uniref:Cell division protein FtsK/SpoIIIE n=1 Tax=Halanaerobium hydrogeniformans TaxID=656519 RepID=E4RKQ4_HALHG|nr:DNA translocase FtsK [Halanaerobium hydrogeniformans]ADQ14724.1 cell division protein FtsK/SpoIIIE [Halanaerobium hydrogeniformans]
MAKNKQDLKLEKRKNELLGLFLITFAAISFFAIFSSSAGLIGDSISAAYYYLVGSGSYILPFIFIYWGIKLIRAKKIIFSSRLLGFIITFITIISIIDLNNYQNQIIDLRQGYAGGIIGRSISYSLVELFAYNGAYIILSMLMLIGLMLLFDLFLDTIFKKIKSLLLLPKKAVQAIKNKFNLLREKLGAKKDKVFSFFKSVKKKKEPNEFEEDCNSKANYNSKNKQEDSFVVEENINTKQKRKARKKSVQKQESSSLTENFDISKDQSDNITDEGEKHGDYTLPGISLLNDNGKKRAQLANKSQLLEETLSSFGVEAKVINVNHGPTITRYEIQPATGVKVSKIVTLSDDIALALAARDVRIEAPIPGKAAVGIEVPHGNDITVSFRDVVVSEEFQSSKGKLKLALGKGIDGDTVVFDLSKMPHLLVAGATGSGKSVCINTLISSILFRATPEEVKLLLIDPKKVELNSYQGLPHLLTPVVTDPKKAANVLKLLVEEMEDRYDLFSKTASRGIKSYNQQCAAKDDMLPYIVVVIDELSDLMMVAANEVEDNICRLAQMSRAAGIHLIIATQRPSVDVITGLIKANIPSRISFAVSSATDSRTILDMGGAEKLLGNGDMLFAPVGMQKPMRIQGAYLTDPELNKITEFVKSQAKTEYEIEKDDIKEVELSLDDEQDELYEDAVKLVVKYRASISMLQRRLHIGHSRAARLIDQMEEDGIVGPYAGSKPREVLVETEDLDKIMDLDISNDEDFK